MELCQRFLRISLNLILVPLTWTFNIFGSYFNIKVEYRFTTKDENNVVLTEESLSNRLNGSVAVDELAQNVAHRTRSRRQ